MRQPNAERTGGQLSAGNIITHSEGGYNFYVINTDGKKYIIGGMPCKYSELYVSETKNAVAVILLTSNPQYCGGIEAAVKCNPKLEIYATASGLRNIKEIINTDVNEVLIKDGIEADGIKFAVTPGLPWVDTVSAVYENTLFSGAMFSGGTDFAEYFKNSDLALNIGFVKSALNRFSELEINRICPSYGDEQNNVDGILTAYGELVSCEENESPCISIIYSSEFGFTKSLAERLRDEMCGEFDIYFQTAENADISKINKSKALFIGTNTLNRNAPQAVWDVITRLDLVNNRGMGYFAFGSFGWAGDGIKLVDKTLSAMGMKRYEKPFEVLFKPNETDFEKLSKTANRLKEAIRNR